MLFLLYLKRVLVFYRKRSLSTHLHFQAQLILSDLEVKIVSVFTFRCIIQNILHKVKQVQVNLILTTDVVSRKLTNYLPSFQN